MRADGIEVSQEDDVPRGIRVSQILQDGLDELFGTTVGVGGTNTTVLGEWESFRFPIDGGRRREDDIRDPVVPHHFQQHQRPSDIVLIVVQRDTHGFPDGFQASKVDHRGDFVLSKHRFQCRAVANVHPMEWDRAASEFRHPFQGRYRWVSG